MVKEVKVKLDLTQLDEEIEPDQILAIHIVYYNKGKDGNSVEAVPFEHIK